MRKFGDRNDLKQKSEVGCKGLSKNGQPFMLEVFRNNAQKCIFKRNQ